MKKEDIKPGMLVALTDNSYSVDITPEGEQKRQYWAGTWKEPGRVAMVLFISEVPLPLKTYTGIESDLVNNVMLKDNQGNIRFTALEFVVPYTDEKQLYRHMDAGEKYLFDF